MADKREEILQRLLAIYQGIDGIVTAVRNEDEISDSKRPAIQLLDADETADDNDPEGRPSNAPRRVGMSPETYILLGARAADIGTEINAMRAKVINAVHTDEELKALVLDRNGIRYLGCTTALGHGRTMEAAFGLFFRFNYVMRPGEL